MESYTFYIACAFAVTGGVMVALLATSLYKLSAVKALLQRFERQDTANL